MDTADGPMVDGSVADGSVAVEVDDQDTPAFSDTSDVSAAAM